MLTKIQNNQITFTDGRFYEADNGEWFPSVTTLLEAYPKPYALLQWMKEVGSKSDEIRDAAGKRGSTVHQLTELYDMGEECRLIGDNGTPLFSLEEWGMFERYAEFRNRFTVEYEAVEMQLISKELGCAGTIDRVMAMDGKRYIVDIKTSNGVYNTYWLQLAAYREMLSAEKDIYTDGVAILWLNAKTRTSGTKGAIQGAGWQLLIREDTSADYRLFEATKALWLAEHADDKPKQFTYQLSHQYGATTVPA